MTCQWREMHSNMNLFLHKPLKNLFQYISLQKKTLFSYYDGNVINSWNIYGSLGFNGSILCHAMMEIGNISWKKWLIIIRFWLQRRCVIDFLKDIFNVNLLAVEVLLRIKAFFISIDYNIMNKLTLTMNL